MRAFRATVFDFMVSPRSPCCAEAARPRRATASMRAVLGWGGPPPAWAPEFEARFGCRLVELYGST